MYRNLFFVKIFFLGILCLCDGYAVLEDKAEYINDGRELELVENVQTKFWSKRPLAVIIELNEKLLEKVKILWENENKTTFPVSNIILASFNSRGLQEKLNFENNTEKFFQAVKNLRPSYDSQEFKPTLHALNELLENLSNRSVLLFTSNRPSDENFSWIVGESLTRNNCELSILWGGSKDTINYISLRDLAVSSGGKFGFLSEDSFVGDENVEEMSGSLKFPEEKSETFENGSVVSRIAVDQSFKKLSVPLIMEVASGASLEVRPGSVTQIPFTVKNNLNLPLPANFIARFNGIIQNVQPQNVFLEPDTSITVTVNLQPVGVSTTSAVGTLTLVGIVANKPTSRSVLISLTQEVHKDRTDPKIYYKYEGDCSNYKEPHNCENGRWGLDLTIHDEESGLLKILSEPYGLIFESEFIAGTKTPVRTHYTATCCQPTVIIWTEDLRGNYVRKTFDVFNQTLLAGEIATVVLGIILLLFIIIGIIVAVVLIKRRNRRNLIIPRPRRESR